MKKYIILLLSALILLGCENGEDFKYKSGMIYPIGQLNAIEFLWKVQYENTKRGEKLLDNAPLNGFI